MVWYRCLQKDTFADEAYFIGIATYSDIELAQFLSRVECKEFLKFYFCSQCLPNGQSDEKRDICHRVSTGTGQLISLMQWKSMLIAMKK